MSHPGLRAHAKARNRSNASDPSLARRRSGAPRQYPRPSAPDQSEPQTQGCSSQVGLPDEAHTHGVLCFLLAGGWFTRCSVHAIPRRLPIMRLTFFQLPPKLVVWSRTGGVVVKQGGFPFAFCTKGFKSRSKPQIQTAILGLPDIRVTIIFNSFVPI